MTERFNYSHGLTLQSKSMNWFLYDWDLRHKRVNPFMQNVEQWSDIMHASVNPFHATNISLYPLNHLKTSGFLVFSGGTEMEYTELYMYNKCIY